MLIEPTDKFRREAKKLIDEYAIEHADMPKLTLHFQLRGGDRTELQLRRPTGWSLAGVTLQPLTATLVLSSDLWVGRDWQRKEMSKLLFALQCSLLRHTNYGRPVTMIASIVNGNEVQRHRLVSLGWKESFEYRVAFDADDDQCGGDTHAGVWFREVERSKT